MNVQYGVDGVNGRWTVFRTTEGGATEDIATYDSENTAELVARLLENFAPEEIPRAETI